MMRLNERIHDRCVHRRRIEVLSRHVAALLPLNALVLDIGCGDGALAHLLTRKRPDLRLRGLDVLVRHTAQIPVEPFDGRHLPYPDASCDAILLVDVLHHTDDPGVLLREARRVARSAIVVKDHCRDGILAGPILAFMDRVGNARHGVPLTYNYWTEQRWLDECRSIGLTIDAWESRLGLYAWPARWVFERSLHFVARLQVPPPSR